MGSLYWRSVVVVSVHPRSKEGKSSGLLEMGGNTGAGAVGFVILDLLTSDVGSKFITLEFSWRVGSL